MSSLIDTSINDKDNYTQFISHLTLCIGVQKGGTTSLKATLYQTNDIIIGSHELHLIKLSKHKHGMDSFDHAQIPLSYELSTKAFIEKLLYASGYNHTDRDNESRLLFLKKHHQIYYILILHILLQMI